MKPVPLPDYLSPIRYDFACRRCFYSLKGLAFDGACPECGQAILQSAAAVASEIDNLDLVPLNGNELYTPSYSYASEIEIAAGVAQVPLGFLAFVIDTNLFVELALHPPSVDGRRDVPRDSTAETYAQALLHFASVYYGAEATEALTELGLGSSEGLGKALSILVRAGIMTKEPDDDFDHFTELYCLG